MAKVYLKYTTWNTGTSAWNSWSSAKSFECLELINNKKRDVITGETKRGEKYTHLIGKRYFWRVVIGADELYSTSKYAELVTFFESHRWRLSEDNVTYYEVTFDAEEMPIDFSAGNKRLKKATFIFYEITRTSA